MEVDLHSQVEPQKNPLVSIIIPTYNRAHLIGETLDSILAQTYTNWECIIVDDGSTDDTDAVVGKYVDKDLRFHYYPRPADRPKGANACRNYGFERSNGEYVNWFDSDDLMVSDKLSTDVSIVINTDFDFTISQSEFFNTTQDENIGYWNNVLWSDEPLDDFIQKKISWSPNAPIWKRQILIKQNLVFDEKLQNAQDYWFHIQAISKGLKPILNIKTTSKIRIHDMRIANQSKKSTSKLRVYNSLMRDYKSLFLHRETLQFITKMQLINILNLYKHKEFFEGFKNSIGVLGYENSLQIKFKIVYFMFLGLNYKMTNVGYRLLFLNDIKS